MFGNCFFPQFYVFKNNFLFSKAKNLFGNCCRKGKIPDLSQADTWYYQVHKIQSIIKHRVLLLDFAFTTQKPTNICQVSCKNQSRISPRVSDDISSLAHVSDDTSGPIKLWHVSPIRLRHMSLTHPQTPINRSLPKAFQQGWRRARKRPRFRSKKASQESILKVFKNFNLKIDEHLK